MKLKNLSIYPIYGEDAGYTCTVSFVGEYGEVKLQLSQEVSEGMLMLCSDLIVEAGQDTANKLVEAVRGE